MAGAAAGVAALTMAYPRAEFPQASVELYMRMLADLPDEEVARAIERLIKRSRFLPTIAEIRLEVSDTQLRLPAVEEAWEIALRGNLALAPPELRAAVDSCGGRWSMLHSESPEVVRSQFTKDYAARRDRSILVNAGASVAHENVVEMLPHQQRRELRDARERVGELEESSRIAPRPVMLRLMRRMAGQAIDAPTVGELLDAGRIVKDGPQPLEPGEPDPLYDEAERVLAEASD